MKPAAFPRFNHRSLLFTLAAPPAPAFLGVTSALAQDMANQLPSWNDGPAKQSIIDFVRATTDQASPKFVPLEERIATFESIASSAFRPRSPKSQNSRSASRSKLSCPAIARRWLSCPCTILRKFSSRHSPACQWKCPKPKQRNGLRLLSIRAGSVSIPTSRQPMLEVSQYLRANDTEPTS
jgi:hypothetical protein